MAFRHRVRYIERDGTLIRITETIGDDQDDNSRTNMVVRRHREEIDDWQNERAKLVRKQEAAQGNAQKFNQQIIQIDALDLGGN